jgi:hypothetical protein
MALDLGGGAFDAQQFGRQRIARAVLEGDMQGAAILREADFGRPG